jgi:cellulose biosynthesis protein BcsQ
MQIIAVYSIKGGVGKTAAAVNLAYLSAAAGHRTLVWDLDPQGAATYYFRVKPHIKGGGKTLIKGMQALESLVKGTDFDHLDLLPADFSLRNVDMLLEHAKGATKQLRRLLRPLAATYDHVFLDCPPSISLMSENIFRAADLLLVPLIPTTLAARTLDQLLGFLESDAHARHPRVLPFFSMVDRRKRLHLDLMRSLPGQYPGILETSIPYCSEVERMGVHRMPLPAYAPRNRALDDYRRLWAEVQGALQAERPAKPPMGFGEQS